MTYYSYLLFLWVEIFELALKESHSSINNNNNNSTSNIDPNQGIAKLGFLKYIVSFGNLLFYCNATLYTLNLQNLEIWQNQLYEMSKVPSNQVKSPLKI